MKIASLLIAWSLSFLPSSGLIESLESGPPRGAGHDASLATRSSVNPSRDASLPDDPTDAGFGASLEDEEDSVEDLLFADGLWLSGSLRDIGRGDRSCLVHVLHDLLRIPPRPHPLRC